MVQVPIVTMPLMLILGMIVGYGLPVASRWLSERLANRRWYGRTQ